MLKYTINILILAYFNNSSIHQIRNFILNLGTFWKTKLDIDNKVYFNEMVYGTKMLINYIYLPLTLNCYPVIVGFCL